MPLTSSVATPPSPYAWSRRHSGEGNNDNHNSLNIYISYGLGFRVNLISMLILLLISDVSFFHA